MVMSTEEIADFKRNSYLLAGGERRDPGSKADEIFARTSIPKRYRNVTWDDLDTDHEMGVFPLAARAYYRAFNDEWENGRGLTFIGTPGIGKTTSMCVMAHETAKLGWTVRYVTMNGLIDKLLRRSEIRKSPRDEEEFYRLDYWLEVLRWTPQLLIIDDVGEEYRTESGWSQHVFKSWFRGRYDEATPTCLTSNRPADKWDIYSRSTVSFLHEATEVIEVKTDKDFRRRARAQG